MATIYVNARAIIERIYEDRTEVIVQFNSKYKVYEFPGGRVEFCESFYEAVKREVKEETGLDVVEASGQNNHLVIDNGPDSAVECFKPWAVYQYVKGSFDAMGVLFKCKVTGEPLAQGDESTNIKWIGLDELQDMLEAKDCFSHASRAAAIFYLKEQRKIASCLPLSG